MTTDTEFESIDLEPEELRVLWYEAVDIMAEHYAQIREVDTFPDTTPSEVTDVFNDPLPPISSMSDAAELNP